jgi:hypothetical protein
MGHQLARKVVSCVGHSLGVDGACLSDAAKNFNAEDDHRRHERCVQDGAQSTQG